jgi:hypothetical protein
MISIKIVNAASWRSRSDLFILLTRWSSASTSTPTPWNAHVVEEGCVCLSGAAVVVDHAVMSQQPAKCAESQVGTVLSAAAR